MATFTAPESLSSDLMPTSAAKYEAEMARRTDETVAVLASATDVESVETAMADMTPIIGTDSADNLTARQVEARRTARRTLLRATLAVTDLTGKDARRIFGINATNLSHVKRGIKRTAIYDALAIDAGDRWSITDLEKKSDKEWDAHLDALTATDDDTTDGGEGEGEDTTTAPKAVDPVKAVERALDAIVGASWDPTNEDDMSAMRAIADLLADCTASVQESMSV